MVLLSLLAFSIAAILHEYFSRVNLQRLVVHRSGSALPVELFYVRPLFDTHRLGSPFIGAILAGEFTDGSVTQLRSLGFEVLHFPVETVKAAFASQDIDAAWEEDTSRDELESKIKDWGHLSPDQQNAAGEALLELNREQVDQFMTSLRDAVTRTVDAVRILPLHGSQCELASIQDAVQFLSEFNENPSAEAFVRYEIRVVFSNGDMIEAQFAGKRDAILFLESVHPGSQVPRLDR